MDKTYEQLLQENRELQTRLEKTEAALRRSEDRFYQCVERYDGIFWIGDKIDSYVSPRFEQIFGLPYADVIDEAGTIIKVVHPDDHKKYLASQKTLLETGYRDLEYRILRPDGQIRYLRSRAFLIYDSQHQAYQSAGFTEDITEHKIAEIALRTSEERYRSVVSAVADGIIFLHRSGEVLTCNDAAERILGLSVGQMIQQTPVNPHWSAIYEDGTLCHYENHPGIRTFQTGEPLSNMIVGVNNPGGSLTWISVNTRPIFTDDDTTPEYVVASFTDITHSKQMESALRESNRQLELSIRGARLGTWDWDIASGKIQYNERYAAMLGYTRAEMEGDIDSWEHNLHPDDKEQVLSALNAHLDGSTPLYQTEYRMQTKNGDWVWIMDCGQVFERGANYEPLRAVGIHLDITEHKQAETHRIELESERQRMKVLADFIRDTSHDLKTPISVIFTGLYLLRKINDEQTRLAKISDIEKHLHYLNGVIDQLQKMALLDSARQLDLKPAHFDMVLDGIANRTRSLAAQKGIEFVYDTPRQLPKVAIDAEQLMLAFTSLVNNAIHYTPQGGTVRVTVREQNGRVIVSIRDTGPGINSDVLPHIFERFYKGDSARAYGSGGAGLGLSITKRIIDLHHGCIEVESVPGQGTTFHVSLPKAR